ncbi:MAG: YesL family protein [Clostridia bacterium]|nr:YesL family protein [Clostridia bacterium]
MGIFDRFYYGKAGQRDYTEANMPKNRLSLFFLVLKDHVFDLVKVNLMQLLFWVPFIFWTYLNVAAMQSIDVEAVGMSGLMEQLNGYVTIWLIGLIPCIAITGPSSAGAAYVMRNWARDQHSFLFSDFKDAFKSNWKQALAVSTITSFIPLVVFTAVSFYSQLSKTNPFLFIPLGIVVMLLLLYTVMLPLLYPLIVGYELSLKNVYRNGILMASASLPLMLLSRIITFIPIFFLVMGIYTGNAIMLMICILYYMFFGFAMSRLIYASFANGIFDKYLNPKIEGAPVGQGLRPADYEEFDVDDDEDEEETADAAPKRAAEPEAAEKRSGLKALLNRKKAEDIELDDDDEDEDDDDE